VIPAEANAILNVRLIPGQSLEDLVARLRAAIADEAVAVTVESRGEEAPSPGDTALYAAIRDALATLALAYRRSLSSVPARPTALHSAAPA
jgi:acetylornithine deacetylase/succinyl-diaminopimelate desuccinylase-like protein